MVVQKTIDSLKEKPHDEKKVVASGIAIAVVIILFIGWGFLFLRKIQDGTFEPSDSAVPRDQLGGQVAPQVGLDAIYQSSLDELRALRNSSAGQQIPIDSGGEISPQDDFGAGF